MVNRVYASAEVHAVVIGARVLVIAIGCRARDTMPVTVAIVFVCARIAILTRCWLPIF